MQNEIQVLRFERHDPHRVGYVSHEGVRVSILEELREDKFHIPRADILMINFWREGERVSKQLLMYAYEDGIPRGNAEEFLTQSDIDWCIEENARILASAQEYPEMSIYLRSV